MKLLNWEKSPGRSPSPPIFQWPSAFQLPSVGLSSVADGSRFCCTHQIRHATEAGVPSWSALGGLVVWLSGKGATAASPEYRVKAGVNPPIELVVAPGFAETVRVIVAALSRW